MLFQLIFIGIYEILWVGNKKFKNVPTDQI